MIRPDPAKWGQTLSDFRRLSVEAEHARTRERFLALYLIGNHQTNAIPSGRLNLGRDDDTVIGWVHTYNQLGPEALYYRRTGWGSPPFVQKKSNR